MAEDSDGTLKAVVICEGDLHDPDFPQKFRSFLGELKSILDPPKRRKRFLKVKKVSCFGLAWLTIDSLNRCVNFCLKRLNHGTVCV